MFSTANVFRYTVVDSWFQNYIDSASDSFLFFLEIESY